MNSEDEQRQEQDLIVEVDRERGLLLSRVVALAFGAMLAVLVVALVGMEVRHDYYRTSRHAWLIVISFLCDCLYALALHFVLQKKAIPAATAILAASLTMIFAFQWAFASLYGVAGLVVAIESAYIIFVGLAYVLANITVMLIETLIINLLTAFVLLVLPHYFGPHLAPPFPWVQLIVLCSVQWIVALLVAESARLYNSALAELGAIKRAYAQAQELDEMKNQFITSVNHELRNPIMVLYNNVDIVRMIGDQMAPEKRQDMLTKAVRAGDRLLDLLKSVLDINKIEQTTADVAHQPVLVLPAVQAAIDLVDPREGGDAEREIHLTIPPGLTILGDEVPLIQIITNLISNAIKYSPDGSPIFVTASVVGEGAARGRKEGRRERLMAELRVRDVGLGVPPEKASLLFRRFARLPRDLASPIAGTGLGLYLCRALTEAMGGTIHVESTGVAGEGSTFVVRLPLAQGQPDT